MSATFILMPVLFFFGIIAIAFEDKIGINKSVTALLMCVSLWSILLLDSSITQNNEAFAAYMQLHPDTAAENPAGQIQGFVAQALNIQLGNVSGTLFFILSSMLLVYVVDRYGGFKAVTELLTATDKRKLLWSITLASFFFSALLDNLAAAIVIIAILRKLVPNRTDRLKYACMAIIACNAGGSWSPIGDVTTLLLWTNGCITPVHQATSLFLPAFVNLLVPLTIAHFWLFKKGAVLRESSSCEQDDYAGILPSRIRKSIFWMGVAALLLIPVWQSLFNLPAFMGALAGVVMIWGYTEILFRKKKELLKDAWEMRVNNVLHETDLATIFYFLGILMSVGALETGGHLTLASGFISHRIPDSSLLALLIGVLSSMLDNVALVAAVMGMYPIADPASLTPFVMNGSFWTFLAYCAVTGGSLLIIGSATGVTVMGMENIKFVYYFKRFSGLALLGYIAGAACYALISFI
ncbi:Na+/H+ antiporter, NhaD family [Porphyromonas macacae]|uniref:Na+/H+ antiporter, NhaD family n=2 Tax=Porphyromonas macacae TaxID=28115 RepID=A0A379E6X5_9PORP|nr:sodium:proton antiporter NhaD [Porphyromonas macacae]SUB88319.1 Na+/H+ antiporter, NhaD family [Porphyromonas macacae]